MNKKIAIAIILGSLSLCSACTSEKESNSVKNIEELNSENLATEEDSQIFDNKGEKDSNDKKDLEIEPEEEESETTESLDYSTYESGIGEEYFRKEGTYTYLCDNMLDMDGYPAYIKVEIQQVDETDIYHIAINEDVDEMFRECGDWDRLDLGYFLVKDDVIYNLFGEEANPSEEKIKSEGTIVYVSQDAMDKYSSEMTDNQYVEWEEGNCIYHYYNDQTESGFYTSITWTENKTLTSYRSGFGAEREPINFCIPEE